MKIAYLCTEPSVAVSGCSEAAMRARELVAALAAEGHDARVFAPMLCALGRAPLPAPHHPGMAAPSGERGHDIKRHRHVHAPRKRWRPDAIYERCSLHRYSLAGLALADELAVPHLLEVHAPASSEGDGALGPDLAPLAGVVERRLFNGTDAVLAISPGVCRYALDHGARPERTRVLPGAVDTLRFQPPVGQAAARTRWGLPADTFVVGLAGSLQRWRGADLLLDAFVMLRAEAPQARLLIAGEGPQEDAVRDRVAALGLDAAVVFAGRVAHAEVAGLLAAMDVAVAPYLAVPTVPSIPLALDDCMAAGLGVVASDVGAIGCAVRDGETGLLCPPGDAAALAAALLRLARDASLRTWIGAGARVEAVRRAWRETARTIATLVAALSADRAVPPTPHLLAAGAG